MFKRLVGSNRALRRRTVTAGPLILSTLIHGALLAAAVVASFKPSGSGDGTEVLRFFDIVQSKSDRSTGVTSAPWSGGGAITPPRLLADSGVEGEVIAEFVVLEDGMVELSTPHMKISSRRHGACSQGFGSSRAGWKASLFPS
jgi:hypothetical protein